MGIQTISIYIRVGGDWQNANKSLTLNIYKYCVYVIELIDFAISRKTKQNAKSRR